MDKLVTRVRQAERHVSRRTAFIDKLKGKRARKERLQAFRSHHKQVHEDWVTTRTAIRQQWALGPLAPKVDLGNGQYGTVDGSRANPETELPEPFVQERCAWAGGIKRLCIASGDRVVVLEGPDSGRIDEIEDIDMRNGTLTLKKLHRADMLIPPWLKKVQEKLRAKNPDMASQPQQIRDRASRPASLPISAVRLVHPLKDPKTGKYRDVMIQELRPVAVDFRNPLAVRPSYNQWEYGRRYDRLVPGINVCIPWPEPEAPSHETFGCDTRANVLLERTFVPTLLKAPIPPQVLDELRGRYSKFRTRHEPWYIAKKEAEAAEKKLVQSTISEMRTPLQDFNRAQREIRRARGQPVLTDDMLEAIGRIMERNRAESMALGTEHARLREDKIARGIPPRVAVVAEEGATSPPP